MCFPGHEAGGDREHGAQGLGRELVGRAGEHSGMWGVEGGGADWGRSHHWATWGGTRLVGVGGLTSWLLHRGSCSCCHVNVVTEGRLPGVEWKRPSVKPANGFQGNVDVTPKME